MVKHIHIILDDSTHEKLLESKGSMTWESFLLLAMNKKKDKEK